MESWRSYATICRLCLQKDGFMLGIFNHIQGKDRSIYKKIIDCTALQISSGDGLPNVICHRCLYKIEFCLEFRQLCFMSDATLRQLTGAGKENGSDTVNGNTHLPIYEQLGGDENVVMVVDPQAYDYESDFESEKDAAPSDAENGESNDVEPEPEPEGRGVIMCKYCDHAFTDSSECLNHEASVHNTDTPYSCGSCLMSFADRAVYSAHLKSVHKNDKPYNCPQCNRTFARRSDLRKHTIVHTGVKPFTCPICFKSFSRNTNLSKHMRIHSGTKPFVCPKCPKTFTSKADLSRHAIIHNGQRPFSCNYCHLSFGRKDKLQRHEKKHFPQEKEDKSRELQIMRENLSIFTSDQKEEAKQEGSSENMIIDLDPFSHNDYNSEATPQRGEMLEHDPPAEIDDDKDDSSYTGSKNTAKPDKPFRCLQCPKSFSKAENLLSHQAIHSGNRPFGCHICNKSFIRKRELDRHIATHSGMKPFKCPRCTKSFGRKDKMMRHMRIHDINKTFTCGVCYHTFNRRDSLHQHMRAHHAIKETVETGNGLE
ncbi:gastrula zinc finger protein XlCGF26.1 [Diabrotica virgifera virgifera]|uniref:Gastrula zinc finger protein XlCGF26.1-like n=1 Tax=Diabrotica virgifera virgifera TaxID=50390 RepID=A0A6P7FI04_DIAVI|nr:gastrula zinc finger protein XlCGF26.1 [Diabrotica virgifera virgifera]